MTADKIDAKVTNSRPSHLRGTTAMKRLTAILAAINIMIAVSLVKTKKRSMSTKIIARYLIKSLLSFLFANILLNDLILYYSMIRGISI